MFNRVAIMVLFLAASSCGTALADAQDDDTLYVTVSPYLWAANIRGNAAIEPLSGKVKLPFHKTLEDLNFAFMGNIDVRKDNYGAYLDGQYLDLSKHMSLVSGQINAQAKAYITQLSLGGYYRAWEQPLGGENVTGGNQLFTIEPTIGIHWLRLNMEAAVHQFNISKSEHTSWTLPFIGVRSQVDFAPSWTVAAEGDVGAWGKQFAAQGQAYLGYRVNMLNYPTILRVGYRVLHQDYQKTDLRWNVTEYGPVVGLSMTF